MQVRMQVHTEAHPYAHKQAYRQCHTAITSLPNICWHIYNFNRSPVCHWDAHIASWANTSASLTAAQCECECVCVEDGGAAWIRVCARTCVLSNKHPSDYSSGVHFISVSVHVTIRWYPWCTSLLDLLKGDQSELDFPPLRCCGVQPIIMHQSNMTASSCDKCQVNEGWSLYSACLIYVPVQCKYEISMCNITWSQRCSASFLTFPQIKHFPTLHPSLHSRVIIV